MLRFMQTLTVFLLFIGFVFHSSQASARAKIGLGGQVVVCSTPRGVINMSLASFENNPESTIQVQGSNEAEAFESLLQRLTIVDRTRAERFKNKFQTFESRVKRLANVTLVNPIDWDESKISPNCHTEKVLLWRPDVLPGDKEYLLDQTHWEQLSLTTRAAVLLEAFLFEERRNTDGEIKTLSEIRKMVALVLSNPNSDALATYLLLAQKVGFKSFDLFGAEVDSRIFSDYNSYYPFSEGAFLTQKETQIYIQGELKKVSSSGIIDNYPYTQRPDIKFRFQNGKITLQSLYLVDSNLKLMNGRSTSLHGLTSFFENGSPLQSEFLVRETELETRDKNGNPIRITCIPGPKDDYDQRAAIVFQEDGSVFKCLVKTGTYIDQNRFITSHSYVKFYYRDGELNLENVSYFDTDKKRGRFRLKGRGLAPIDMYERNHNPNQWGDAKIRVYIERWENRGNGLHATTYDRTEMYVYDEGFPVETTLGDYPYTDHFTKLVFAPNRRCHFLSSQKIDGKIKWYRPQVNENIQRVAIGTLEEDAYLKWSSETPKKGQGINLKAGTRVHLDLRGDLLKFNKVCR